VLVVHNNITSASDLDSVSESGSRFRGKKIKKDKFNIIHFYTVLCTECFLKICFGSGSVSGLDPESIGQWIRMEKKAGSGFYLTRSEALVLTINLIFVCLFLKPFYATELYLIHLTDLC
jgi:hypothetical protein